MLVMYKGALMHRTQIYFEESMFEQLRQRASGLGLSVSAFIRETLQKELDEEPQEHKRPDLSAFSGMWKDRDDVTLGSIREKAWK